MAIHRYFGSGAESDESEDADDEPTGAGTAAEPVCL
jgi:hypothetical protein